MSAYYNEIDPAAAETLRELIKAGEIAHGDVDTRSIEDVTPNDVRGYTQCHWFAGVGGWSRALRLAGWSDSKFAWTGSCPCQPFSSAGKGAGVADVRHLWPAWMHLIRQCRPGVVVGEQVSAAVRHGWLDAVLDDLENSGYACWAADLPAAGIGAPHLRERIWFVGRLADGTTIGHARGNGSASAEGGRAGQRAETLRRGDVGNMARADSQQRNGRGLGQPTGRTEPANGGVLGNVHSGGRKPRHETGCSVKDDNRSSNLRECTTTQNNANVGRRSNNSSGFTGVWVDRGRWQAGISINGKWRKIGSYSTIEDARAAYVKKAMEARGEFLHPSEQLITNQVNM